MEGLLKDGVLCATAVPQLWLCQVLSARKGARGQREASPDVAASKESPVQG